MKEKTLCILDKLAFLLYVGIVLYILNPVMIVLVLGLLCSPTIAIVAIEISTLLIIAGCAIIYHYFVWLKLRGKFLRYEGMYFDIFVPKLIDRRRYRVPVKHNQRRSNGDTTHGKPENKQ